MTGRSVRQILVIAFFVVFVTGGAWATTYNAASDLSSDFASSLPQNPNGVWSYGMPAASFVPYDAYCLSGCPDAPSGMEAWYNSDIDGPPAIALYEGQLQLAVSETMGDTTELIFTAPATGYYVGSGSFTGGGGATGMTVGIINDGTGANLDTFTAGSQTDSFNSGGPFFLDAGDPIVFYASPASGSSIQTATLDVTISTAPDASPVPESSTGLNLLLGSSVLLGVVWFRRRSFGAAGA